MLKASKRPKHAKPVITLTAEQLARVQGGISGLRPGDPGFLEDGQSLKPGDPASTVSALGGFKPGNPL